MGVPGRERERRGLPSLAWRPAAWLQMPMVEPAEHGHAPDGRTPESPPPGPPTQRLPPSVMWWITFIIAVGMAMLNFLIIFAIEFFVSFKFRTLQSAIRTAGVGMGILAFTGISMFYALCGVCIIQLFAPNCTGSGLPENKCYLNGSSMPGLFTKRTMAVRVASSVLANAAGFPVGREGPMVTMGSNLAYLISRRLAKPYVNEWISVCEEGHTCALLVNEQRYAHATRVSCAVGGACAMAVIFNAPFGGLLYMFEEITSVAWPLELTFRVFVATMFCSLLSYGLCYLINSEIEEFVIYAERPQDKEWESRDIPVFIAVSALLGVVTSLHTRALLAMWSCRRRMSASLRRLQPCARMLETVLYAGFCALVATVVSLSASCTQKGTSGLQYVRFNCEEGEYNPVASLLVTTSHSSVKLLFSGTNAGEISPWSSLLAFLVYFCLNVGLSGLPVPGGAFTATMLLGGLLGRSVGELCRDLGLVRTVSGVYAVVGSAAMLCGFKQMTLASVLIVVECVNDLRLAPIVMLGVAVALAVNWRINERGHDEEQIARRGLPFLEGEAPHELDSSAALGLCDPLEEEAILSPEAPLAAVRRALSLSQVGYFPVRDGDDGPCIGIVSRQRLESALQAADAGHAVRSIRGMESPTDNPFGEAEDTDACLALGRIIPGGDVLPVHYIMDPTPFTVVEDMPAARLYALFAKAGERAICVTSIRGELRGIISREGLIAASRRIAAE